MTLILGIGIGAQIRPRIGPQVPKKQLRQLFGVVMLYAAGSTFLKALK